MYVCFCLFVCFFVFFSSLGLGADDDDYDDDNDNNNNKDNHEKDNNNKYHQDKEYQDNFGAIICTLWEILSVSLELTHSLWIVWVVYWCQLLF